MCTLAFAIAGSIIIAPAVWPWMSLLVPGLLGIMITYVAGEKLLDSVKIKNPQSPFIP